MSKFPTHPAVILNGHNGPVHCVTFSAGTGSYVLTGSADRTIRLFNPAKLSGGSGKSSSSSSPSPPAAAALVQTFSAHGHEVLDLSVSQDNSRFASVGGDRQVFLWDVATGTTVRRWSGHSARVNAVTFAGADDTLLVSGSFDATVRLWDVRSGSAKPIQTLTEARDSVAAVAMQQPAGGGSIAAAEVRAGSTDGRVRTYDVRMGVLKTDVIGAPVTSLDVTRDGEGVLVGTLDGFVRLFDGGASGKCLREYKGHKNASYRIRSCLGLNDSVVLGGSEDGGIYVWDVVSGEVLHRLDGVHEGKVPSAVAWNGRKKEWASAGSDGEFRLSGGKKLPNTRFTDKTQGTAVVWRCSQAS